MGEFIEIRALAGDYVIVRVEDIRCIMRDTAFNWKEDEDIAVYAVYLKPQLVKDIDTPIVLISKNEYNRLANLLIRKN